MIINLKPCVFCHRSLAALIENTSVDEDDRSRFQVVCTNEECGAKGPSSCNVHQAIWGWNKKK